ncbi:MAG TPA: HAMP domain-containing sensor histidine kinase [Actinomycetota bacterium]|nr:HAMP domain-containing sensor histidine kinase [Actinomycetota bacterium]
MTGPGELHRLERWLICLRWFAVAFGATALAFQPVYPSDATKRAAWGVVVLLALGNSVVWGTLARTTTDTARRLLAAGTFAFDAVVVMALVTVFAFETPYVTWALLLVLPLEGALRYRMRGALAATAAVAAFFVWQSWHVAEIRHASFDVSTFVFVVGLCALVAGVTGSMSESWHRQAASFEAQSARLAEIDRVKDRFIAVTSHEIRGPLTAIIAGVDTIQRRGDRLGDDQRRRVLQMVSQQGHQLARLVDDLLVTSQLRERKLALHVAPADLRAAVDQALEAAAARRRAQHLEVFVEPLTCDIDASRVSQVVRNLVENAYKYTPERARISVAARADDGGIVIEVADDGDGIPPNKRDKLFEAFGRGDEESRSQEGVGLGLYVVSELVSAMGGRIDLASSSLGTSFRIHIPCDRHGIARRLGLVMAEEAVPG